MNLQALGKAAAMAQGAQALGVPVPVAAAAKVSHASGRMGKLASRWGGYSTRKKAIVGGGIAAGVVGMGRRTGPGVTGSSSGGKTGGY